MAVIVDAHGHGRLAAAVADRLDLLQFVGPGQQVLAALEQFAAEVRAQPVAQHRNAQRIDHLAQLPDLRLAQELRLIHQQAVERAVRGDVPRDQRLEIVVAIERHALRLQADPRGHGAAAGAMVQPRREDQRAHPALAVVVRRLQQRGRLPGIHRRVVEVELGHGAESWIWSRKPEVVVGGSLKPDDVIPSAARNLPWLCAMNG